MEKNELKALTNSDLLTRFLMSRDSLLRIKMEIFQSGKDKFTNNMLEIETAEFTALRDEIYRRMK